MRWPWSRGNRHAWERHETVERHPEWEPPWDRIITALWWACRNCGASGWPPNLPGGWDGPCTALPVPAQAPERDAASLPRVSGP